MTDISLFAEANAQTTGRVDWRERERLVVQVFPETESPPWEDTLADDATLERVLEDLLKHEQLVHDRTAGRTGPPRGLDWDRGMQSWKQLTGQDYTSLLFHDALRLLARDSDGRAHSVRAIAHKTGIARACVDRLIRGIDEPSLEVLEQVARAYGKKPGFFAEWRAHIISRHLVSMLATNPEYSAVVYRKVIARREATG